jgi:hypothetical protein
MNYRQMMTVTFFNFPDMFTTIAMKSCAIMMIAVMRFKGE